MVDMESSEPAAEPAALQQRQQAASEATPVNMNKIITQNSSYLDQQHSGNYNTSLYYTPSCRHDMDSFLWRGAGRFKEKGG